MTLQTLHTTTSLYWRRNIQPNAIHLHQELSAPKYHQYVSQIVIKAALVNSEVDSNIVKDEEKVEDVYVMHFKDCPYKIKGLERQIEEIGPNIFNLLCEWKDLEEKLGEKKSKFDTLDA